MSGWREVKLLNPAVSATGPRYGPGWAQSSVPGSRSALVLRVTSHIGEIAKRSLVRASVSKRASIMAFSFRRPCCVAGLVSGDARRRSRKWSATRAPHAPRTVNVRRPKRRALRLDEFWPRTAGKGRLRAEGVGPSNRTCSPDPSGPQAACLPRLRVRNPSRTPGRPNAAGRSG